MTNPIEQAGSRAEQSGNFSAETATNLLADVRVNPIEKAMQNCVANSTDNHQMSQCFDTATTRWDSALNDAYKTLKSHEDAPQQKALLDSQRQWLQFRDLDANSIASIYQGHGREQEIFAGDAIKENTKTRAIELQNRDGNTDNGTYGDRLAKTDCAGLLDIDCAGKQFDDADAKLNSTYQQLLPLLSDQQKTDLVNSERAWIKYRDLENEVIDQSLDSRFAGNRIESVQAKTDIVQSRVDQLQRRLDIMQGN